MSTHTSRNGGRTYLAQNDPFPLLQCALHLIRPHLSLFDAQAHVRYRRLHSYLLRLGSKGQELALLADRSGWNMWPYAALAGAERGAHCSKSLRTPLVGAKWKARVQGEIGASRKSLVRREPVEPATKYSVRFCYLNQQAPWKGDQSHQGTVLSQHLVDVLRTWRSAG